MKSKQKEKQGQSAQTRQSRPAKRRRSESAGRQALAGEDAEVRAERERIRSLNDDDIEADRHNVSAGAFEAT